MTQQQKWIIAALASVAVVILTFLGCITLISLQSFSPESEPALAAALQESTPTPLATPSPDVPRPTETVPPSPTSTRVVTQTVQPTPVPTRPNCITDIQDFGQSGVLTNEEVEAYLRATVPLNHLDNCLGIRYIDKLVTVYATPAAGRFIPLFRQISVYKAGDAQTAPLLLDTLVHEVGHNVHFNIRIDDWDLAVRWRELHVESQGTFAESGFGFVSDYARTDHFEDFAESYRGYILLPDLLESVNPQKYEFMRQEVFAGREYGG